MKGERTMAAEINNIPYKIYLSEDEMPKAWYNVRADMKVKPAPLLNPGTGKPWALRTCALCSAMS